jgi:hypothetical protein
MARTLAQGAWLAGVSLRSRCNSTPGAVSPDGQRTTAPPAPPSRGDRHRSSSRVAPTPWGPQVAVHEQNPTGSTGRITAQGNGRKRRDRCDRRPRRDRRPTRCRGGSRAERLAWLAVVEAPRGERHQVLEKRSHFETTISPPQGIWTGRARAQAPTLIWCTPQLTSAELDVSFFPSIQTRPAVAGR